MKKLLLFLLLLVFTLLTVGCKLYDADLAKEQNKRNAWNQYLEVSER